MLRDVNIDMKMVLMKNKKKRGKDNEKNEFTVKLGTKKSMKAAHEL